MVISNIFDVVLGFCGSSTIPTFVTMPAIRFIQEMFVDQTRVAKDALIRSFAGDLTCLKHTSVAVLTKKEAFSMGVTVPGIRAFGCTFPWCGNLKCQSQPRDVLVMTKDNQSKAQLKCSRCGWLSGWLGAEHIDFVTPVGPSYPHVYFAPFPLNPSQQMVFARAAEVRDVYEKKLREVTLEKATRKRRRKADKGKGKGKGKEAEDEDDIVSS
jgi:hypothetical protein